MKDNSEEDTQYFNKNQQDTYKKKDGKPSYVNLRNLAKSVILDDEVILLLYSNIIYWKNKLNKRKTVFSSRSN